MHLVAVLLGLLHGDVALGELEELVHLLRRHVPVLCGFHVSGLAKWSFTSRSLTPISTRSAHHLLSDAATSSFISWPRIADVIVSNGMPVAAVMNSEPLRLKARRRSSWVAGSSFTRPPPSAAHRRSCLQSPSSGTLPMSCRLSCCPPAASTPSRLFRIRLLCLIRLVAMPAAGSRERLLERSKPRISDVRRRRSDVVDLVLVNLFKSIREAGDGR